MVTHASKGERNPLLVHSVKAGTDRRKPTGGLLSESEKHPPQDAAPPLAANNTIETHQFPDRRPLTCHTVSAACSATSVSEPPILPRQLLEPFRVFGFHPAVLISPPMPGRLTDLQTSTEPSPGLYTHQATAPFPSSRTTCAQVCHRRAINRVRPARNSTALNTHTNSPIPQGPRQVGCRRVWPHALDRRRVALRHTNVDRVVIR